MRFRPSLMIILNFKNDLHFFIKTKKNLQKKNWTSKTFLVYEY
jgi:hypothetical protein